MGETIAVMVQLNASASRVALAVGAHGVTDVTGFGLVGHAFEMGDASGVTLEISASAVPLIGRTRELAAAGALTRTHKTTLEFVGQRCKIAGADELLVKILADAQTSGGLLMAVPAERAAEAVGLLKRAGTACAAEIGHVREKSEYTIVLLP